MTKKVLIVGGGPAGLACAIRLADRLPNARITLIDKKAHHLIRAELYHFLADRKLRADYTLPFDLVLRGLSIEFVKDTVKQIHPLDRSVELFSGGHLTYDFLVVALGNITDMMRIPGLADHSWSFKEFSDANRLKKELKSRLNKGKVNLVIGGGGISGVELAGSIRTLVDSDNLTISLIEQNSHILPGVSKEIVRSVEQRLQKNRIYTYTDQLIKSVTEKNIHLSNTRIPYDILVWTGGSRGNPIVKASGLPCDEHGFATVNKFLQARGFSHIFIIGDSAKTVIGNKRIPHLTSAAFDQGWQTAENITRQIRMKDLVPFCPHIYPTLITIGQTYGALEYEKLTIISPIIVRLQSILLFVYLSRMVSLKLAFNFAFAIGDSQRKFSNERVQTTPHQVAN